MRMLFTTMPVAGHLRPLVPIAEAALRAGHEVAVCTPAAGGPLVEAYGLRHLCGGTDWVGARMAVLARRDHLTTEDRARLKTDLVAEGLAGTVSRRMADDILVAARTWSPDIVVRENAEFGGYLAAEVLGVPHVSVGAAGGHVDQLAVTTLAPALDACRASLGLPPDRHGARTHAYLHASLVPVGYHAAAPVPRTRHYRQTSPLLPGERLPGWLTDLPAGRPFVLAAFGTVHPLLAAWDGIARAVIAGLGGIDCTAVVVVGAGKHVDGTFAGAPVNVRLADRVPQPLVLECCDLFVTHGGFNSVREALRLGVPMVVVPWLNDSTTNARRCMELGTARMLPADGLAPADVRDACREVLGDPGYRAQARAVQRQMLELPGMDTLVTDLEALARKG